MKGWSTCLNLHGGSLSHFKCDAQFLVVKSIVYMMNRAENALMPGGPEMSVSSFFHTIYAIFLYIALEKRYTAENLPPG
jgi:hypothetical protein